MDKSLLENFADQLKSKFALPASSNPEDQLKAPVSSLLEDTGAAFSYSVETRTEAHLAEHKVRPDIAIFVDKLICGYVELKAPGLGADAPRLKGKHNKEQWKKLQGLPNLIYTDGREWALYRNGERQGGIIKLDYDPTTAGKNAIDDDSVDKLEALFRDFLTWDPSVPHKPSDLAKYLAPLTRFLRGEVEVALQEDGSNVGLLAAEWRQYFFPEADDGQFADAYAQTVTYAMLLARLMGAQKLDPSEAAKTLNNGNGLLAEALKLLGQDAAKQELRVGFELLQRSLEALNPVDFLKSKPDLWLYFYEDFLAAYDPKLRRDYGVYYTPREVVELQVRLASELLETRFNKKLGFADDGVVFLDPAVGTGTYLVATVKHAMEKVKERSGPGAVAARAEQMAANMHGFEILVGPYAVAHLRLTQAIEGAMNDGNGDDPVTLQERLKIYLADTLESPDKAPPGGLDLTHKALTVEHEAARKVKNEGDILVCLGNPPYDRQHIEEGDTTTQRKGGWVRFGNQVEGAAKQEEQGEQAIFKDFTEPVSNAGKGNYIANLYNDYVYFWRWALWRLYEQQETGGIVSFITASSFLSGPGFIGMREMMRRTFDELWIIDLGGDNIGTRKTPNVFNIQTPVAIAIGVRGDKPSPDKAAVTRYMKIVGDTREAKLDHLSAKEVFADLAWKNCPVEWQSPLLPEGNGDFFDWPNLNDIFPWSMPGAKFHRSWPIGETKNLLENRWKSLLNKTDVSRKKLFHETRDRKFDREYRNRAGDTLTPISRLDINADMPDILRYSFRSYDRQYAIVDNRVGDYLRLHMINPKSSQSLFFSSLSSEPIANGQAIVASAYLPDLHHFNGRGGKDIIPLYRDADGTTPNITKGLPEYMSAAYGTDITAEDFAGYVYAVLGNQSYSQRFWNELETPGPRIPITKDSKLFQKVSKFGQKLIWLHTYAERFQTNERGNQVPAGSAKCLKSVSSKPDAYPEQNSYDPETKQVTIGDGKFGPVEPAIWEFEVSGLKVVQSWLGYRMKVRSGKKSSPLDDIRPERWTPAMTDEFLELIWVLEATLDMEPELSKALDDILAGECFTADELPTPSDEERKPPTAPKTDDMGQMSLLGDEGE